ncbi:hypothetical protein COCOBI_03-7070 [Coccomyxa sp. Obi]|nr:hypothetical protein COCOBI_03-7070 [Coccomyxa sp. Obi]
MPNSWRPLHQPIAALHATGSVGWPSFCAIASRLAGVASSGVSGQQCCFGRSCLAGSACFNKSSLTRNWEASDFEPVSCLATWSKELVAFQPSATRPALRLAAFNSRHAHQCTCPSVPAPSPARWRAAHHQQWPSAIFLCIRLHGCEAWLVQPI